MADSVEIEEFARAYFEGDRPPYIPGGDLRKNDHGYYLRLDFAGIDTGDLESLVAKARDTYDRVEVVERVIEGDEITKERRYVENEADVPDGYMAERGPKGGIYYETKPRTGSAEGSSGPGNVSTGVGYSGEPVLAVQFEDVDTGDRIAFEKPDSGERDMGEVVSIDEDENTVTVTSGDGETDVLAAPLEGIEKEGDGGGTMTSSTAGAHNAVYSPDEDEEDDLGQAAEVSKEDAFEADVFRVLFPEDMDETESDLAGIGVDFPNHDVYVDWRNSAFEDELDNPHVSVYGSVDDLEQATGNIVEPIGTVDGNDDSLAKMAAEVVSKAGEGHIYGDYMEGGLRLEEGEAYCEAESETFRTDEGDDVVTTCPECGEGLGDHGEVPGPDGETGHLGKADGTWVSFVGPDGGEGWVNLQTGEKRYQTRRPGPGPEGYDEPEFAEGWSEPPDAPEQLLEGQTVEFQDASGEYHEARYGGVNEQGYAYVETGDKDDASHAEYPVGPEVANEITAAGELGTHHPATDDVVLDPDEAKIEPKEWHRQVDVGDSVYADTTSVDVIDAPAKEFEVMGWAENSAAPAVKPSEEMIEAKPNAESVTISEADNLLSEEEYEEAMRGQHALDDMGVEVGEDVVAYDGITDEYMEAEVIDPIDGQVAVETPDGGTFFPETDADIDLIDEYEYNPDDFDFSPDFEVGEVSGGDAAWVDGDGPYRVSSTPHPDDEWLRVYDMANQNHENVSLDRVDAHSDVTPPQVTQWWENAPGLEDEPEEETDGVAEDAVGEAVDDGEDDGFTPTAWPEDSDGPSEGSEDVDEAAEELLDEFDGDDYSPDKAEEFRDMSDIGANHGNSVSAMEVAVMPDGSKWVHKDVDHHTVDQTDIDREMAGYEAAKHLDENVPAHAAGDGWAASEVAPGVDAIDATPEMKEAVTQHDFYEMAAVQLMIGNTDLHQNNLRVDEEGNLHPFDLDRAGGDLQGDWVGALSQYDDTLDRALGELEKSASALGVQMDRDIALAHARDMAIEIYEDEDTFKPIVDDAKGVNDQMGEVIRQNIEALYEGVLSP